MQKPIVLCFSGADPCGGAGIQADIEAIASMRCHATTITTALTVQNSQGVTDFTVIPDEQLRAQSQAIIDDMPIAAIKTGMLANRAIVATIADIVATQPNIPLVVDPVISANTGANLSAPGFANSLRQQLLPVATIITPNLPELYQLAPDSKDITEACRQIANTGCEYVLVTGTHDIAQDRGAAVAGEHNEEVVNRLYQHGKLIDTQRWPRLPGEYHGSGCTLASALAALLARGHDMVTATRHAQDYTWHSLASAARLGQGQYHPDRFFWATSGWLSE